MFLVVINFPKVLSSADAYAARPDAAELIFRALVSEAAPSIDGTIRVIACVKGVKFNEDWDIKKFSKMLTQGSSTPKDVEKRSVKRPACQG